MESLSENVDFKINQFTGQPEKRVDQIHTAYIWCMTEYKTQDSHFIITSGNDLSLKFWNVNQNFVLQKEIETGHIQTVFCIEVLDDETLVTSSSDQTVKIFKKKGFFRKEFKCIHTIQLTCSILNLTKITKQIFATGGRDNVIRVFNVTKLKNQIAQFTLSGGQLNSRFRMDYLEKSQIFIAGGGPQIEIFSLKTNKKVLDLKSEEEICCFMAIPEGYIITGHMTGSIQVWWFSVQNHSSLESRIKMLYNIQQAHGVEAPVFQISRLGERYFTTICDQKKGFRVWKFMPEDGQTTKVKTCQEDSKTDINFIKVLDDKRIIGIDMLEKRLVVYK